MEESDDTEVWIRIDDWGTNPGRVSGVVRSMTNRSVAEVFSMMQEPSPLIAYGGIRELSTLARALEEAGAKISISWTG